MTHSEWFLLLNVLMMFALILAFHELKSRTGTVGFFAWKINAMLVQREHKCAASEAVWCGVLGLVLGECSSVGRPATADGAVCRHTLRYKHHISNSFVTNSGFRYFHSSSNMSVLQCSVDLDYLLRM